MFSFTDGYSVARIDGGKYNRKFLKIDEEIRDIKKKPDVEVNPLDYLTEKEIRKIVRETKGSCTTQDLETVLSALRQENFEIAHCAKAKQYAENKLVREIKVPEGVGTVQQIPNGKYERQTLYLSGAAGCGKSTYIAKYVKEYHKKYPGNEIFMFSEKPQDEVLDSLGIIKRIKIDMSFYLKPISIDAFGSDCLVIFDDIDSISNVKIRKGVYDTLDKLLNVGRSKRVSVIVSTHIMTNYKETRIIVNNSADVVLFPGCGSKYYIEQFCKKYVGMSKKQIDKLFDIGSRWVCIHKEYPMFVLYDKGAFFLD